MKKGVKKYTIPIIRMVCENTCATIELHENTSSVKTIHITIFLKKKQSVKTRAIGRDKHAIGHEKREFHGMIFPATKQPRKHEKHEISQW